MARLGHLWITKYHLFLNTTIIMGYSVVTGASPDRPGETGTLKASGCLVIANMGLFWSKFQARAAVA